VGEDDADSLEGLLGPYLARLEQFLTSPGRDEAAIALSEQDKVSPKAKKIAEICRKHIDENIPGKILIFTQFVDSAETIFEQLPQDLQDMCIHYTAANKFKCGEEFENNPQKRIMVGVETSMNTGLNLQFCSRLIRVESVWSPGTLEQGESRINRPNMKGKELRKHLYFDWVVVNKTIDVTKMGRLIGKLISAAKFENAYEPTYQALPDTPLISMNMASLRSNNDVQETLREHLDVFKQLGQVQADDFENYRNDPKIDKTFKPVAEGMILEGSSLLREVPYVSGMDLFGAEDLGLAKFFAYCRHNPHAEHDPKGLICHTEFGDGVVTGMSKNRLRVKMGDGTTVSVMKLAAFIVTKGTTSTKSIRSQLAKLAGLKLAEPYELDGDKQMSPVEPDLPEPRVKTRKKVEEIDPVVVDEVPPPKGKKRQTIEDAPVPDANPVLDGSIDVNLSEVNGSLAISVDGNDPDLVSAHLKSYGFILWNTAYYYLHIETARQMRTAIDKLEENFTVSKQLLADLEAAFELFSEGKQRLLNPLQASRSEFRNFFLERKRKVDANTVRPYIYISADRGGKPELYIVVDAMNTPAAAQLKSLARVPGTAWTKDTDPWIIHYGLTRGSAKELIERLIADGIKIGNLADFKTQWKSIKPRPKKISTDD
jgi:hypothetical protein